MSLSKHPRASDDARKNSAPRKRQRTSDDLEETSQDGLSEDPAGSDADSSIGPDAQETPADTTAVQETPATFSTLGIIPQLCEACEEMKYTAPTPIQAACIPTILSGQDLIGLAETGSGKTAAYALPLLQALMEEPKEGERRREKTLYGLVLAPTRELAYQISQMIEGLGAMINVRTAVIVGGMDMMQQAIMLAKRPHVIVATPGRILDHLQNTKGFSLRSLRFLVLDEADRLLDMDFGPSIDKILNNIPSSNPASSSSPSQRRRTMLFSATMTKKVSQLQRAALYQPIKIALSTDDAPSSSAKSSIPSTLQQTYLFFPYKLKDQYLLYLLSTPLAGKTCIIFIRIIHEVDRLHHLLNALGLKPTKLHGHLSQPARLASLNKFKSKQSPILLATDIAARGLDISSVDAVLNYDMPDSDAVYIHRVGRTARAGKAGVAINLVTQYDVEAFQRVEKTLGFKMGEYDGGVGREVIDSLEGSVREAQAVAGRKLRDEREGGKGARKGGGVGGARGQRGAKRRANGGDGKDLGNE